MLGSCCNKDGKKIIKQKISFYSEKLKGLEEDIQNNLSLVSLLLFQEWGEVKTVKGETYQNEVGSIFNIKTHKITVPYNSNTKNIKDKHQLLINNRLLKIDDIVNIDETNKIILLKCSFKKNV